jgi:proline dehydrogenase
LLQEREKAIKIFQRVFFAGIREKTTAHPMALLRSAFLTLARSRGLRHLSENSGAGRRLASRFVAGTDIDDALEAAQALTRQNIAVTLDSLGENVGTPEEAGRAAQVYHRLLDAISAQGLGANISVKLTQMGVDLDPSLALELVTSLVTHAAAAGSFVRVDMESSAYTESTLHLVRAVHAAGHRGQIGVVIQAYLRRSEGDVSGLLEDGISIRLCKGAYEEPASLAFPEKSAVDENFHRLMKMLLVSGTRHAIATHDERMIAATRRFAQERGLPPSAFEFQMLYGIRRDLQRALAAEGYHVRVYLPFGKDWYPYFMRRLAERPANALFLAKNILR